jgi:hypothetical protein
MTGEATPCELLVQTTGGPMTPATFLEEVFENVWPDDADMFEFSLKTDTTLECSVTYVVEPFGIVKTIDYEALLDPDRLAVTCGDVFSIAGVVNVYELAESISNALYADFVYETIL